MRVTVVERGGTAGEGRVGHPVSERSPPFCFVMSAWKARSPPLNCQRAAGWGAASKLIGASITALANSSAQIRTLRPRHIRTPSQVGATFVPAISGAWRSIPIKPPIGPASKRAFIAITVRAFTTLPTATERSHPGRNGHEAVLDRGFRTAGAMKGPSISEVILPTVRAWHQ